MGQQQQNRFSGTNGGFTWDERYIVFTCSCGGCTLLKLRNVGDVLCDTLYGAKYYCSLDMAHVFWELGIMEEDMDKIAFATRKGLFSFKVMPFGLTNAPCDLPGVDGNCVKGLTAFATCKGLFSFKVMPFGTTNAPATFQGVMEIVLRDLQGKFFFFIQTIYVYSVRL